MIFVRDIQRAVAEHYAIPLNLLKGPSRERIYARPRLVAMCLSRRLTDKSTVTIGRCFKRDHSTIVTGASATEKRCQTDPELATAMRRLTLQLVRH